MIWRRVIGRTVGLFYIVLGVVYLYVFSTAIDQTIFEGAGGFLPSFEVSSTGGYYFSTGQLPMLIQIILFIPAGILLAWKLRRWAAIIGIIGTLVMPLTTFTLRMLISASGGPPLTELITFKELVFGIGLFVGLPVFGIIFAWKELH